MLLFWLLPWLIMASPSQHDLVCQNFGLSANCTLPNFDNRITLTPIVDQGIFPISFGKGNLGLAANVSFVLNVNPNQKVAVIVFDCFCFCDKLGILVNDAYQTQFWTDPPNDPSEPCLQSSDQILECLAGNSAFSAAPLFPGFNNVTITAGTSPLGAGAAYVYFFTVLDYENLEPACASQGIQNCNFEVIYPELPCPNPNVPDKVPDKQ